VTAQVTQNVFDSTTGQILLVPQGARLIGKYDSIVAFGQQRALVIWQRLILLDGSSLRLDNFPATDAGGYAGLADKIDFHSWSLLKGVAIATLLGVGSALTINGEKRPCRGHPGINPAECLACRRPTHVAQPRHPTDDHGATRDTGAPAGQP
jgi:type IV secretory pathway VirB10-like protein